MYVTKRDGRVEAFSRRKLENFMSWAVEGLRKVDFPLVVSNIEREIYDKISTKDLVGSCISVTKSFIEIHPDYDIATANLTRFALYKEVIADNFTETTLDPKYRLSFIEGLRQGIEIERLSPELSEEGGFDIWKLSNALEIERDLQHNTLSLLTLKDRYLQRNPNTGILFETPQAFWMRIAMGLALAEKRETRTGWALRFYEMMSTLRVIPSTPTLFHSGTMHPQLSSCYLTTVPDDLEGIYDAIKQHGLLSKYSGGLGNDWTSLRGLDAPIKTTGVGSQGVIPFLKISDSNTAAINRSGKRRGAACAYLECWHIDYVEFLDLRKNTGDDRRRTHDMNTASWIPDLFMKRVMENGDWTLFSPDETPDLHEIYGAEFEEKYIEYERKAARGEIYLHQTMKASDLWKKMITMLFSTGHPWITYKDPCNVRSPQDHAGVVHSSNLCTEITLNTSVEETAVCSLASINLPRHLLPSKLIDTEKLAETISVGMRMLDNGIDVNYYPTKEASNSHLKHRPVGLGMMGLQDVLYEKNICWDSEEAVQLNNTIAEIYAYHAILSSSRLAGERGAYSSYKGSKWDRGILPQDTLDLLEKERGMKIPRETSKNMGVPLNWDVVRRAVETHGMRNSNCMAIAPTVTISNIAGSYPCIEPQYKTLYVKSNKSGEFTYYNKYFIREMEELGVWDKAMLAKIKLADGDIQSIDGIPEDLKRKYMGAFEIPAIWVIRAAAARGQWIDQSQSLNLFQRGMRGSHIAEMYMEAWLRGLKTTYYLRSMGATHVEKSTTELSVAPKEDTPLLCSIDDPDCEACQ